MVSVQTRGHSCTEKRSFHNLVSLITSISIDYPFAKALTHIPEEWLKSEDAACFDERASRLSWLISNTPDATIWTFPGGWLAKNLFEEMRYCYVYGQFLATVMTGFSYVERTLSAMFYASGRNDLQRASSKSLFEEARKVGWLDDEEYQTFDKARQLRNPLVHFRRPLHPEQPEYRAVMSETAPYDIVESDARHILAVAFRIVVHNAIG